MLAILVAAVAGLSSLASAQDSSYPYLVAAGSVDISIREQWCTSQNDACRQICYQGVKAGPTCVAETLTFVCKCAGMPTPDLTKFNNTLYFSECQEYIAQCQINNTQNPQVQKMCLRIQCGGMDPAKYAASQQSTSSAPMPTPTSPPGGGGNGGGNNGNPGGSGGSGGSGNGNAAAGLVAGNNYSLGALVATGLVIFGFGVGL